MRVSIVSLIAIFALPAATFAQSTAVTSAPAKKQPQDGFTMVNGMLYEVRNGQLLPVTGELTLRISPNGVVTGFDGKAYTIPPGVVLSVQAQVLPFSGTPLAAVPPPLTPLPTDPGVPPVPPVDYVPTTTTTIYTGPEIISLGTSTFVPPPVIVVPGTVTVPAAPAVVATPVKTPPRSTLPVTNNPFSGAAPAAMGVNTTATGNQQNTLGTQQIRPGMGNAVGTGGGPRKR